MAKRYLVPVWFLVEEDNPSAALQTVAEGLEDWNPPFVDGWDVAELEHVLVEEDE